MDEDEGEDDDDLETFGRHQTSNLKFDVNKKKYWEFVAPRSGSGSSDIIGGWRRRLVLVKQLEEPA